MMWKTTFLLLLSLEAVATSPCWQGATFSEAVVAPAADSSGILRVPGVVSLPQCVAACCDLPGYDLAWLFEGRCYVLSCRRREDCQPRQRPGADSFLAFLRRASPQTLVLQSLVRGVPYASHWGPLSRSSEAPGDLEALKDLALFNGPRQDLSDAGMLDGKGPEDMTTNQRRDKFEDGPDSSMAQNRASSGGTARDQDKTWRPSDPDLAAKPTTFSTHHDHIKSSHPTLATPLWPTSETMQPDRPLMVSPGNPVQRPLMVSPGNPVERPLMVSPGNPVERPLMVSSGDPVERPLMVSPGNPVERPLMVSSGDPVERPLMVSPGNPVQRPLMVSPGNPVERPLMVSPGNPVQRPLMVSPGNPGEQMLPTFKLDASPEHTTDLLKELQSAAPLTSTHHPDTTTTSDPSTNPPKETSTDPPSGTSTDPPTGTSIDPPTGTSINPPTGTSTDPPTGTSTNPPTRTSTDPSTRSRPSADSVSEVTGSNRGPVAVVGPDRKVLLPMSSLSLDGSRSTADHGIVSYHWDAVSGPLGLKMEGADQAVATATGLRVGRYTFRLTVCDQQGATDRASLVVRVQEARSLPPVAHASGSHTLSLPNSSVVLRGSVTEGDQDQVQYLWVRDSQSPAAGDVLYGSDSQASLYLANLVEGTYLFQLRVTDAQGRSSIATATVEVRPEPGGGEEVELEMLVSVSQVSVAQRDTVVRQLAALLHVLDGDIQVRALQGHSHLSTVLRFTVWGPSGPVSGSRVVGLLRNQLLREKSDYLLFRVLRVDTVVCLLGCSGRGQCDPVTKECTCDPFWTENLIRRYLGDGESNCEWRVLYIILTSFILVVFILSISWTFICCCKRRRQTRVRKKTRYTILDNMDDQERVELRPKFSIKHRSTEHNSSLMMSESELDSDQDTIFSRDRPIRSRNRISAHAACNENAFG